MYEGLGSGWHHLRVPFSAHKRTGGESSSFSRTLAALDFVSRIRPGEDFAAESMHHRPQVVGISSFDSRVISNRRAIMAAPAPFYIRPREKFSRGIEIWCFVIADDVDGSFIYWMSNNEKSSRGILRIFILNRGWIRWCSKLSGFRQW